MAPFVLPSIGHLAVLAGRRRIRFQILMTMSKQIPDLTRVRPLAPVVSAGTDLFVEGLGQSMRALEEVIRGLAVSDAPVLILAERGAGKESTARHIHQLSLRAQEPINVVGCSSLAPSDLRSYYLDTQGGTLYLEEIADLSAACQEVLLQLLPAIEGGSANPSRARLICGSARDLEALVANGHLREDVYYRTSGICLRLPPLRQRREDIPHLMGFFLERYAREFKRAVPHLSVSTQHLLREYDWPGNIRELEDAACAIVALGDEQLAMEGFRQRWQRSSTDAMPQRISLKEAARAASRKAERELILRVLDRTRWNRRRAAEELQISYKALLYKLKQVGDYRT